MSIPSTSPPAADTGFLSLAVDKIVGMDLRDDDRNDHHDDSARPLLRGIELRYVLTDLVAGPERRTWQVKELTHALEAAGFFLGNRRPSKLVSDALRAEISRGRVVRVGWGRYRAGHIPGATRRRIRTRARAARVAAERAVFADVLRSAG